jgi:hypothetical protein
MNRFISFIAMLMFLHLSLSPAFAQQPKTEAEIRRLIEQSRSKDLKTADAAEEALSKVDSNSLPALTSILKKGNPCERVAVARWFVKNDPQNKDLVPAMAQVATGGSFRTLFHLEEEMMCRRAAFYVLATSANGLSALTRLMREGDTWERQSAVFALDDLTETSNYPDGSVPAFRELIPELAKATKAKDRTLSGVADEVLRQIARGSNAELAALAKKYVSP